jgi:hypothetical protein
MADLTCLLSTYFASISIPPVRRGLYVGFVVGVLDVIRRLLTRHLLQTPRGSIRISKSKPYRNLNGPDLHGMCHC